MIIIPLFGMAGILFAVITFFSILKRPEGLDKMRDIAHEVHKGAMVFLRNEYTIILIFVVVMLVCGDEIKLAVRCRRSVW